MRHLKTEEANFQVQSIGNTAFDKYPTGAGESQVAPTCVGEDPSSSLLRRVIDVGSSLASDLYPYKKKNGAVVLSPVCSR